MFISTTLTQFLVLGAVAAKSTVYLIRHGEKPSSGDGLNADGLQRGQCLRTVFGASSSYSIEKIIAQTPQSGIFLSTVPSFFRY